VAGQVRPYYIHVVAIHVGGWLHENVPVGFMPELSKTGHGLLGQYGFFNLFKIQFDLPKGEIDLKEIKH